ARCLARLARRRLPAAHQLERRTRRRTLEEIHPTDRSRSGLPCIEKRAGHPAYLPSERASRESAHPRRVPRLCPLGDVQTSLETQTLGSLPSPCSGAAVDTPQRRHHLADDRPP